MMTDTTKTTKDSVNISDGGSSGSDRERAKKDLDMLKDRLVYFRKLGFDKKYPIPFDWASRYYTDAKYYFKKSDYFTSFGCANYGYGILDGILLHENKHT